MCLPLCHTVFQSRSSFFMPPFCVAVSFLIFLCIQCICLRCLCLQRPPHEQNKKSTNPAVLFEGLSLDRLQKLTSSVRISILATKQFKHIFAEFFVELLMFKFVDFSITALPCERVHHVFQLIGSLGNLTAKSRCRSVPNCHELTPEFRADMCHLLIAHLKELGKCFFEALFPHCPGR